jgi:hypothetical protein
VTYRREEAGGKLGCQVAAPVWWKAMVATGRPGHLSDLQSKRSAVSGAAAASEKHSRGRVPPGDGVVKQALSGTTAGRCTIEF